MLALLVVAGCGRPAGAPAADAAALDLGGDLALAVPEAVLAKIPEAVLRGLRQGVPQEVILHIDEDEATRRAYGAPLPLLPGTLAARAAAFSAAKHDLVALLPLPYIDVLIDYEQLPLMFVRFNALEGAVTLLSDARAAAVYENDRLVAADEGSLALIRQPEVLAAGRDGRGTTIAVLDSGLDYTRAAFGPCTAPAEGQGCTVIYAADLARQDGALDDSGHGTQVAATALGVAPGARLIALDVFDGATAAASDVLTGINWVVANAISYNVAAINLSLAFGRSQTPCQHTLFSPAVAAARAVGVLTVAAAGNDGFADALAVPACVPGVLSAGAVYSADSGGHTFAGGCTDAQSAADQIPCFSDSASFLSLLAPGAMIDAAGDVAAGTSQAAAHVTGAVAVLRAAFPRESIDDTTWRLTSLGRPLTDSRNQVTTPRLDLAASAAGCVFVLDTAALTIDASGGPLSIGLSTGPGCRWQLRADMPWLGFPAGASGSGPLALAVTAAPNPGPLRGGTITVSGDAGDRRVTVTQGLDTQPPVGTVTINGGAAATRGTTVALAIDATDASGVVAMCISNTPACGNFVAWNPAPAWTLPGGDGKKVVYVFLRDGQGNQSDAHTAPSGSILLDTRAPTGGTAAVTPNPEALTLFWDNFTDALSGVVGYQVSSSLGSAPQSCAKGTPVYSGPDKGTTDVGLKDGETYYYRVCAVDAAGNVSVGVTTSGRPRPEENPPTGSITLDGGAASTNLARLNVTLDAVDDSGLAQMCLSATNACVAWQPYAGSAAFTLPAGDGPKTVNAWFSDLWGNVTPAPASAAIVLDTTPPTDGQLVLAGGDGQLGLSWKNFTDALTGVTAFKVVFALDTPPAPGCAAGTLLMSGWGMGYTHKALNDGVVYAYRVCAVDATGNVSAGATARAFPAPEYNPPTGAVTLDGGAPLTRDPAVAVQIDASDESGVASMCISTTARCVSWQKFASPVTVNVPSGSGMRTVYVGLRDVWGNTTAAPLTAQIELDTTPPQSNIITTVPGSQQIAVSWTAARDPDSGVAGYQLVVLPGASPPASYCNTGTLIYTGADLAYTDTGLAGGQTYTYRLCATDNAGNVSSGVVRAAVAGM